MKFRLLPAACLALAAVALSGTVSAQSHTSKPFSGPKVNGGTVTHTVNHRKNVLSLSAEFQVPDTPDPHWQIVDSKGRVYLLDRLPLKGDRVSRSITVPSYIEDVAKVQIYCAWAEALLGETTFERTLTF
jgi:hypothetical protein